MNLPACLTLAEDGRLPARAAQAVARLSACTICARRCGADRTAGTSKASCRIGRHAVVHAWGGGFVHFAGCNLRCLYCPTPEAAWDGQGDDASAERLADLMVAAQAGPVLELVKPSHVAAQVIEALPLALARGLRARLAWVSGGYDSLDTLALLDGIVDLYVVDAKYGDSVVARQCSGVAHYVETNRAVVAEMHRQVGPARRDDGGRVIAGLVVRHLVLPNGLAGTRAALAGLPPGTAVRLDAGYRPLFRANRAPRLNRPPTAEEVAEARAIVAELGLVALAG